MKGTVTQLSVKYMNVRQFITHKCKTVGTGHLTKVLDNKGRIASRGLNRPIGEHNNSAAKWANMIGQHTELKWRLRNWSYVHLNSFPLRCIAVKLFQLCTTLYCIFKFDNHKHLILYSRLLALTD